KYFELLVDIALNIISPAPGDAVVENRVKRCCVGRTAQGNSRSQTLIMVSKWITRSRNTPNVTTDAIITLAC
ncbi:TPA: hypothetical protein ACIT0Y_004652, partial [Salmonella enterica subsp. enterica serovar Saintpaul]